MIEKYILTGEVQYGRQYQITDSESGYKYKNNKSDKQKICDLLNSLSSENEQLKKDNNDLKEVIYDMDPETYEEIFGEIE